MPHRKPKKRFQRDNQGHCYAAASQTHLPLCTNLPQSNPSPNTQPVRFRPDTSFTGLTQSAQTRTRNQPQPQPQPQHHQHNGLVRRYIQRSFIGRIRAAPVITNTQLAQHAQQTQQIRLLLHAPYAKLSAIFLRRARRRPNRRPIKPICVLVVLIFVATGPPPPGIRPAHAPRHQASLPRYLSLGPSKPYEGLYDGYRAAPY